jgi:hypothetical protein
MAAVRSQARLRRLHIPPVAPIVRFGCVLAAFVLGAVGFQFAYAAIGQQQPLSRALLLSLRLIVGNFPTELEARDLPLALVIARIALPLLTFWSTIALAWAQIRNPLGLRIMRLRGEHLVIAGDAGLARLAAAGELEAEGRVLIWAKDKRDAWVSDLLNRGAIEVEAKGGGLGIAELGLNNARGVLLLAPDDTANTARAAAIMDQAVQIRPAGDPLPVIVRVDDLDLRRGVEERFARSGHAAARVRFVSLPDLAARQLFLDWPLGRLRRVGDQGRRVFLFGLTPTIERYVLRMLSGGHFRDGVKPLFLVVDPDAKRVEAEFRARNPNADALSPVVFEHGEIGRIGAAEAMLADLVGRHGAPVAIVIDCGEDASSLALALAIDNGFRRQNTTSPLIHVRLEACHDARLGVMIHAFGTLDSFADPELLVQSRHDILARSIHDFYLEGRLGEGYLIGSRASMNEWDDLPESFRDDNRLVADCYQLKLRDIGARLIEGSGQPLRFEPDELEELARAEHDRWMAAKLSAGWVHGSVRDDSLRIHPDIVPYDDLEERIKDLDREQIRVMTRLLGSTGRRALRTLTVALDPGGGSGLAAGLAAVLSDLAAHYPDRVLLVLGAIGDAASRRALVELYAAGGLVQIAVAGNIQKLVDELPGDERAAAIDLVRAADCLLMLPADSDIIGELRNAADLLVTTGDCSGLARPVIRLDERGAIVMAPWRP